jgi:hypothetical protein
MNRNNCDLKFLRPHLSRAIIAIALFHENAFIVAGY